ncbi:aminoacyl-tRNA hydrolase [Alienimonas californiensis]|uniref:Peptidyl-tRNA hydrolase n=1 Tax=Alienimonas californiensis TaxID=2527989 RepID=A0A517PF59_9PLAN|nr:aminoacyl-tRNA hydrolase [Alienimonas californiensis]QDT18013.1 Peptidyl-tRNA hydrolase [Alienimonas californiensis]
MKLVVGLGNPGDRYRGTRHNVGWEVLAELARRHAPDAKPESNFEAETLRIEVPPGRGRPVFESAKALLVSPLTYMNLSGRSVAAAARFHKVDPAGVLIVCDDLNLPSGRLRLRGKGSAGGQNGLKDVIEKLGTDEFPRLRVGVGRPPGRVSAADYVLSRFTPEERTELDLAVQDAADAVELWLTRGLQPAMNAANAPPPGGD